MTLRSIALCAALALGSSLVTGCAADTTDEIAAVDEATADLSSVSKLLGQYAEGSGRYASLSLTQVTENGKRVNRYVGKQVVQCVRAPCPQVDVGGRWFASASSLTLYPNGQPRESYKVKLEGTKLTLSNAQGVSIAELNKVVAAPPEIASALQRHGVPNMKVDIDPAEIAAQAAEAGELMPFATALDSALEMFLTDDAALKGTTQEFADSLTEECGSNTDLVRCLANSPRTKIHLMTRASDGAPEGESVSDAWIFEFFVDDFTDHGYYAIVPKTDDMPYVYAFN